MISIITRAHKLQTEQKQDNKRQSLGVSTRRLAAHFIHISTSFDVSQNHVPLFVLSLVTTYGADRPMFFPAEQTRPRLTTVVTTHCLLFHCCYFFRSVGRHSRVVESPRSLSFVLPFFSFVLSEQLLLMLLLLLLLLALFLLLSST